MNNDELIAAGHELAKCLDSNTPLLDIAKMIVRLADKLDVTTLALREKTKQCEQLAAENAALKDLAKGWANATDERLFEEHGEIFHDSIDDCEAQLKTICPATDAFLREVRAQVWIKGSEPPEFGRYWVRYETDVGPQYCSAKWMEYNFCAPGDTNIHKIWVADHSRSINSLKGVTHYAKLPEAIEGGAA
ncbi:hypothetical protein [Cronobacter dublinensis]|uniref:hypothetical protein n=1 Tax=Cronobacter dublinensis TaxID=413497 RepID=UPI001375CE0C|nr:hypothetical protein [Cronobacter dublinensis]NCH94006.1 hypothetical protein [Cronobacter dublinensis]